MKGFTRGETRFSLCGLNCALCSMHLGGYCPGCGGGADDKTITVGATPNPHAEILEQIKPELEAKGYTLVVKRHRQVLPGARRRSILLGVPGVPLFPLRGLR